MDSEGDFGGCATRACMVEFLKCQLAAKITMTLDYRAEFWEIMRNPTDLFRRRKILKNQLATKITIFDRMGAACVLEYIWLRGVCVGVYLTALRVCWSIFDRMGAVCVLKYIWLHCVCVGVYLTEGALYYVWLNRRY